MNSQAPHIPERSKSDSMLFNQNALPSNITKAPASNALNMPHATPKNTGDILFDNTAQHTQQNDNDHDEFKQEGKPCVFKLPEHFQTDEEAITQFSELITTLGIDNDKAQMLIDFAVNHTDQHNQSSAKNDQETQHKAQQEKTAAMVQQAQQDREFGGAQLNQSMIMAQNALQSLGNDALIDMLEESGLGNHPEMIRLFYRVGKHMNEDQFVSTNSGSSSSNKSLADILYS